MDSASSSHPLPTHEQRVAWLAGWADAHNLTLDLEGEVGFGRECVGILDGHEYVDWDYGDPGRPGTGPGDEADDAYHKHNCLAVLGRDESAVEQLYAWIHRVSEAGCTIERGVPKDVEDIGSLFGRTTRTVLRRAEKLINPNASCYVDGCDWPGPTEHIRLHVSGDVREVDACPNHAAALRMMSH